MNEYNKWNGASFISFPDYSGHSFVGWNTESDGSGSQYSPGSSFYVDGSISYSYPYTKSLFAVWKPIINKVIYGSETLIDLTGDTVGPSTLLSGFTAHAATGEEIVGTFDSYTKTEIDNLLNAKADSADIPTNVSDLNNDAGYIENGTSNPVLFGGNVAMPVDGLLKVVRITLFSSVSIAAKAVKSDTYTITTSDIGAGWTAIGVVGYSMGQSTFNVYRLRLAIDSTDTIEYSVGNLDTSAHTGSLGCMVLCIRTSL